MTVVSAAIAFCDDIRFESSGKAIIIGVYAESLIPSTLPQSIPLSFWIRIAGMSAGRAELNLSFGVDGVLQHNAQITVDVQDPEQPVNLYLVGVPISFERPGRIFVEISGFQSGQVIRDFLNILAVPNQVATASEQVGST